MPEDRDSDPEWLTWLILSGRGWGKTRVGAETVSEVVRLGLARRVALVGETAADCRDVMIEGDSGILRCSRPDFRPVYEPSKRRLTWPNGAVAHTYNATEPDQLRGPQHDFAWSDEMAKWQYAQETWDQLQFGLRLGLRPRQLVTTTPRPIPLVQDLLKDPTVHITRGRTLDNAANLAASFMHQIQNRYAGTRLGRQELNGEVLDDATGALWTTAVIDQAILSGKTAPAQPGTPNWGAFYSRIVVAVDPSGADGESETADDIGLVVAARGYDGRAYVLQDATLNASPLVWGRRAVGLYHSMDANLVVAERNFGGAMVQYVIQMADSTVPYKEVTASRGKAQRAEPIAALYEQGRVSHVGSFPMLEDEMRMMTSSGYLGRGSPNRLDALVWALSELMLDASGAELWAKLAG
jgi:phage terminase large subunit-like protein